MIKTPLKLNTRVLLLTMVYPLILFACSSEQSSSPTPTPQPPQPSNTPGASPIPFTQYGETLRDVVYCSPDGSPQRMDIYFPESGGPWPAVLYVHGGGWMHGDKSEAGMFAPLMT